MSVVDLCWWLVVCSVCVLFLCYRIAMRGEWQQEPWLAHKSHEASGALFCFHVMSTSFPPGNTTWALFHVGCPSRRYPGSWWRTKCPSCNVIALTNCWLFKHLVFSNKEKQHLQFTVRNCYNDVVCDPSTKRYLITALKSQYKKINK